MNTMTIESARRIDAYYTRMSTRHKITDMPYHMGRWMTARAYLVANDPDYIWEN